MVTTSVIIDTLHQAMGLPLAHYQGNQANHVANTMPTPWIWALGSPCAAPTDLDSHGLQCTQHRAFHESRAKRGGIVFTAFYVLFIEHQAVNIPNPSRIRSGMGFVYQ